MSPKTGHDGQGHERAPAPSPFRPLQRPTPLFMRIAEELVAAIRNGTYPAGSRLPSEAELAVQFGTSRPSVREALSALQFAGYIEAVKGSGTVVAARDELRGVRGPTAPSEVVDLLEARMAIEPAVAALVATGLTRQARRQLIRLVEGMAIALDEPGLHAENDLPFHRAIVAACPNPVLREDAERLLLRHQGPVWQRIRDRTWPSGEGPKRWLEHHRQLVDALCAGEPELAAAQARRHLASVLENVAGCVRLGPRQARRVHALTARLQEGQGWP